MGRSDFFSLVVRYANAKDEAIRNLRYGSDGKQKEKKVTSDHSSTKEKKILNMNGSNLQEPIFQTVEKEESSFNSSVASNAIAEVDDEVKNGYMQLDQVADDSVVPLYRRLLDCTKKSDRKISRLNFDIESYVKRMRWFSLLRPQKEEHEIKKVLADECLIPHTEKLSKKKKRIPQKRMK